MFKHALKKKIQLSLFCSALICSNLIAEDKAVKLGNVDIVGQNETIKVLKTELEKIPGGTNLINLKDITTSQTTISEVLKTEPGVIIQEFFGGNDQPRLNIRGSGIQSNPVNDGVNLLYDGLSINQADGSFVIGLLNTAQHDAISVFRGSNALKYGAASLGGAINFTPKSGLYSDSFVDISAGSYSTKNINAGIGGVNDALDYYIGAGYSESDGYRTNSNAQRKDFSVNLGYQISDNIENRTLVNFSDNFFHISGPLLKSVAEEHPDSILGDGYSGGFDTLLNLNNRNPHRDSEQLRVSNKTTFKTNNNVEYQVGLYAEHLDDTFTAPLTHAVTESKNVGINLATKGGSLFKNEDDYELSLNYNHGSMPVEYWVNSGTDGSKLFQFADLDRDADNIAINAQYNLPLNKKLKLVADLQYLRSTREISGTASTLPLATDALIADIDEKYTYDGLNPKLGLIYNLSEKSNIFTNVSRSMIAPTFNQLVYKSASPKATSANAALVSGAELVDLDEQEAITFELGTKGSFKDSSWQASYYYTKVKDELITVIDDGSVINGSTSNYTDKTTHQGIELGFNQILTKGLFDTSDVISTNIVYNYNHFTFDGGTFEGNKIAGVPEQTIYLELAYNLGDKLLIAPNISIQPNDNYTDHSNTESTKQDAFSLLGLKLSYKPQENLTFYTNLNNITDEVYASSYIVSDTHSTTSPYVISGTGFNYTFGMKYTW